MEKKTKSMIVCMVVCALLLGTMGAVQAVPYVIYGQVFDTDGVTPVDGVAVTVSCYDTGESQNDTTASGGYYVVTLGNEPYSAPQINDTLQIFADAGNGRINTTTVKATGTPQIADIYLVEDAEAPVTTVSGIEPEPNMYGWNNMSPVTVSFARTDNSSGVDYTNYSTTSVSGPWMTEEGEDPFDVVINTEGNTTIWYYSVDNVGNLEDTQSVVVKIDLTAPTVEFIDPTPANGSTNTTGYVNATVEVTDPSPGSQAEDVVYLKVWNETGLYRVINESAGGYQGFAMLSASADHKYYFNISAPDGTPLPSGVYTYQVFAQDLAGNTGSSDLRVITVMKEQPIMKFNFTMNFVTGYNMIGIPVNDTAVTKAAELANKIGGSCTQLSRWDTAGQEYITYIPGVPRNNFEIVGGDGYFVIMTGAATVVFIGEGWESPFTLSLVTGYNMIDVPVNDTAVTKAAELANKIGGSCTQLSRWDTAGQEYITYIPGVPRNNFEIVGGDGYFVIMTDSASIELAGEAWSD